MSKWVGIRDTSKFLKTELGQEILHYVPHLFDTDKEKHTNNLYDDHDNSDYDIVDTDRYQQEDNRK